MEDGGRRPSIEPDPYDDAEGIGFAPLERWGDRRFALKERTWTEETD